VFEAAPSRLRLLFITAACTTSPGFVPILLAGGVVSEVQRTLATVLGGSLVSFVLLTRLVLPVLYARSFPLVGTNYWAWQDRPKMACMNKRTWLNEGSNTK
jgi:Cu/Ag efflux pump CusA